MIIDENKVLEEVWMSKGLLKEAKKIVPLEIERTKKAIDLTFKKCQKEVNDMEQKHWENGFNKAMDLVREMIEKELGDVEKMDIVNPKEFFLNKIDGLCGK